MIYKKNAWILSIAFVAIDIIKKYVLCAFAYKSYFLHDLP